MTQIAKEYATALFSLASEEKCTAEIAGAIEVMAAAFEENGELEELLSSPAVSLPERLSVITAAFGGLHEHAVSFLKLLCEHGLVRKFNDIAKEFNALFTAFSHVSVAKITSAVPLTEEELSALVKKLAAMSAHEIEAETYVDASLIGGMIIELDGKIIDASLRQRLGDVKDVISK